MPWIEVSLERVTVAIENYVAFGTKHILLVGRVIRVFGCMAIVRLQLGP